MLSLSDLLAARDFLHVHLLHKTNVIGTAVGRYLVRKTDPYPPRGASNSAHSEPRAPQNSEVRKYSWPYVIVLVRHRAQEHAHYILVKGLTERSPIFLNGTWHFTLEHSMS